MEADRFKDIDLKFNAHPISRAVKNVDKSIAINRALTHLFFTRQGEKLYDSDFGIGIEERLFEMNNFLIKDSLITFIKAQINNYERRINLLDLSIDNEGHYMTINLSYSLKSEPERVLTYQKTIKRIR
jgi:phage baseplate assembly protein W